MLMALIPTVSGVAEYRFDPGMEWTEVGMVTTKSGPSCVYSEMPGISAAFYALVRSGFEIREFMREGTWQVDETTLPFSLCEIRHTPSHRVLATNPISISSPATNALGHSQSVEAIAFHAAGAGWQNTWMILHWSCVTGTGQWIISDVVLPHVTGMPL